MLTGTSFATNASVDARLFSVTAGQDSLALVGYDPHFRYHCAHCYSWVYGDSGDYAGLIFISCGTLNEALIKQVDHHVRVDSKAAWVEIRDDLPQFLCMQPPQALGVK